MKNKDTSLGRLHLWWLKQFEAAKRTHGKYTMCVGGYEGTPYGRALGGLMTRGYVSLALDFSEFGLLTLTDKGIAALAKPKD